jgi:beta-lactam-binding protein with PASTA domain
MALLLLTVALTSALITMRIAVHAHEVQVPDVRGRTPAEARVMAEARGLSSQIEKQYYSSVVAEGRVVSQMPLPGSTVRRGWQLRLAVSLGPQRVTIPQVTGESERAAAIILQQRGLDSAVANVWLSGTTAGQVVAQDPPANAAEVQAPKVSLLVSTGEPSQSFVMPSFVGRPLGSAAAIVKGAGFIVGRVNIAPPQVPSTDANVSAQQNMAPAPANPTPPTASPTPGVAPAIPQPYQIVISQEPAAGQQIAAGAEVRFVVR